MGTTVQTIPRRLLGGELRRLRVRAGKSQTDAGRAIGKDPTRINKLEDGRSNLTPEDLDTLLDFLGADDADRAKVATMAAEARKRQPRTRVYVDLLPGSYRRIASMQGQASEILSYERGLFPGLLQCADYADAVVAAGDDVWWESSYDERVNRVKFRLERQRLVFEAAPAKKLEFIVTDDALRTEFGSPQVMRRQFEHVLRVIDEHADITIRLLGSTTRNNPVPHGGFTLLGFESPAPSVAFMSVVFGPSPYLDDSSDTDTLTRVFTRLQELAFSETESRTALEEALRRTRA